MADEPTAQEYMDQEGIDIGLPDIEEGPDRGVRRGPGKLRSLILGVLEDPNGEDALNLALFILQDPEYRQEYRAVLDELRAENSAQIEAFERDALQPAQEFVESGLISDTPGMPGSGPMGSETTPAPEISKQISDALKVASLVPGAGAAKIGLSALKWMRSHKLATSLGVLGGSAVLMQGEAFQDTDPGTGSDHNAGSPDPTAPPPGSQGISIVDPATGQSITLSPEDINSIASTGQDPTAIGSQPSFGESLTGTDFIDQRLATGTQVGMMEPLDPRQLGSVTLSQPFTMPSNIAAAPMRQTTLETFPNAPGRGIGQFAGEQMGFGGIDVPEGRGRTSRNLGELEIPAGANIAPRALANFRGRSLLEWGRIYAARYGVPFNILYGMIDYESGWDPNAVGDNGTSFGLAQIHRPAFPNISRTEALDPRFALDFTARMLRERYDEYGRWDAAIAAHNSPVAAQYLAKSGQFYNAKSQSYVGEVMNRSNNSGLASNVYSAEEFPEVGQWASLGSENAVFPVQGAQIPKASQIGLPRDGGARHHQGLDIMAEDGKPVVAAIGGRVRYATNRGGKGGFAVSIEDAMGNWHYYAHLSPQSASLWQQQGITEGAIVNPGTLIGYVGNTGNASGGAPHLHYSINEGRKDAPLIDPFDFLNASQMAAAPEFAPFAGVDPSLSKDFIRGLYADLFGRDPTEDEFGAGQERLTALAQQQYYTDIRQARGAAETDMDIEGSFAEELRGTGEFEFAERRSGLRTFTDYASKIAAMLQGGL